MPTRQQASAADPAPVAAGRTRYVVAGLLVVVLAAIAVIVLSPYPPDAEGQRRLAAWLADVHRTWMPRWVTFGLVEFLANVALFVPLGLLGALLLARRRWRAVIAGMTLSIGVEIVQAIALPARQGSWADVVANTLGAGIGWAIVAGLSRRRSVRASSVDGAAR